MTYALPFPIPDEPTPVPWDLEHIPYAEPSEFDNNWQRTIRALSNQDQRAMAYEQHLTDQRRYIERLKEEEFIRNDPECIEARRRRALPRGTTGRFLKVNIEARNRHRNATPTSSAPPPEPQQGDEEIHEATRPGDVNLGTPRSGDLGAPRPGHLGGPQACDPPHTGRGNFQPGDQHIERAQHGTDRRHSSSSKTTLPDTVSKSGDAQVSRSGGTQMWGSRSGPSHQHPPTEQSNSQPRDQHTEKA